MLRLKNLVAVIALFSSFYFLFSGLAFAQTACDPNASIGSKDWCGFKPNCTPNLSPAKGGCGLSSAVDLLRRIIQFMLIIIFPITTVFVVWGGIDIMLAGGNPEKVSAGKKKILVAITGLVIALVAWLAITALSRFFLEEAFQIK